jgi:hypothetical protein
MPIGSPGAATECLMRFTSFKTVSLVSLIVLASTGPRSAAARPLSDAVMAGFASTRGR